MGGLTPCNAHFRTLAEHVKRGVYEAGGLPIEFPVMSLRETLMRPTTMLFRNLVSMDVEARFELGNHRGLLQSEAMKSSTMTTIKKSGGKPTFLTSS